MDAARFSHLLSTVTVRLAASRSDSGGLYVQGLSQEELAEIVTLAGQRLGEVREDARVNPEYLALGPEADSHLVFHPEALRARPRESHCAL